MPDVMQEFVRETVDLMLKELPPEKLLEHLSEQDRLKGLSPETRLEGLSDQQRLQGLSPKTRLNGLSKEEMLQMLEELAQRLKNDEAAEPSQ